MTRDEMCKIVDTARRLLSDGYVHLQLKQSIHAANPLDRLRALTSRLTGAAAEGIAEAEFHDEMVSIFTALRICTPCTCCPGSTAGTSRSCRS